MNVAAIQRAAKFLWPGFRRILLRLGRWVLRELVYEGVHGLVAILRAGSRRLKSKLAAERARKRPRALRIRFHKGRIRRWQSAARWLEKRTQRLQGEVVDLLVGLAGAAVCDDALPERAPLECYSGWRRLVRT